MATKLYTGDYGTSALGLNATRTVSLSSQAGSAVGICSSVILRAFLSCNGYTKSYNVVATITSNGKTYTGTASGVLFNSSNYSGATISIGISVDSSFDINGVTQLQLVDTSANKTYVFCKSVQNLDVNYIEPTKNGAPSSVALAASSANPGATTTLTWGAGSAGTAGSIDGYWVEYCESSDGGATWGSWYDVATTAELYVVVSAAGTSGYKRKFRVRTLSGLNSAYDSDPRESGTLTSNYPSALAAPSSVAFANTSANPNTPVNLTWGASANQNLNNVTGYEVQYAVSSNGGATWGSWSSAGDITTYLSYALTAQSTYGYIIKARVRAQGSAGVSYYSAWAEASNTLTTNYPTTQTAPTAFSLSATLADPSGQVTLSWSGAANKNLNSITGYEIQYATSTDGVTWGNWTSLTTISSAAGSGSTIVNASSSYGVYIKYQTRVQGSAGAAYYSAWKESTNTLLSRTPTACAAPTSISLDATTTNPGVATVLRFSGAAGGTINAIARYKVEQSDSDDLSAWSSWSSVGEVVTSATSGSIEVTSPTTNGRYRRFRVQTQGAAGSSYYSSWAVSGVNLRSTPISKCGAPTNAYVSPINAEANASLFFSGASSGVYNDISGYGYQYADSTDGVNYGSWSNESNVALTGTSGDFTVAVPSTAGGYRKFRIRTHGSAGSAYYSDWYELSIVLRKNSAPTAPTTLSFDSPVFESVVRMQWSGAQAGVGNAIASYTVAYSISTNGTSFGSETVKTGITNAYYDLDTTGIARGSYIRFRVLSVGAGGTSSSYSDYSVNAKRNTPPNAPSAVIPQSVFDPSNTQFSVQITDGGDVDGNLTGYEVALQYADGSWYGAPAILLKSNSGIAANLNVNGSTLARGSVFFVAVRAYDTLNAYSPWKVSTVSMTINPLQSIPVVVFPTNGKITYNQRPRFGFRLQPGSTGKTFSFKFTFNGVSRATTGDYATEFSRIGTALVGNDTLVWMAPSNIGLISVTAKDFLTNDGVADLPIASRPSARTISVSTTNFTDPTLVANLTQVKAAHINELRAAIHTMQDYYGLTKTVWAESITAGVTGINKTHIYEMRNAIDAIIRYVNLFDADNSINNIDPISWTDTDLTSVAIKAVHVQEIRDAILTL